MAGRLGVRTVLSPSCDPAVHEPLVAREALVRPHAQPLGHTRTETFEEDVRTLGQPQ